MHSQLRQRSAISALRSGLVAALVLSGVIAAAPAAHAIRFWGEEEKPAEQQQPQPAAPDAAAPSKPPPLVSGLPNFADLAEALRPAVVNISTTSPVEAP